MQEIDKKEVQTEEKPEEEKKFSEKIQTFSQSERKSRSAKKSFLFQARAALIFLSVCFLISALAGSFFGFLAGSASRSDFWESFFSEKKTSLEEKTVENRPILDEGQLIQEDGLIISSVEKASNSVVSIIVSKDVPKISSFFSDPFFDDPFFNPFGFRQRRSPEGEEETERREIGGGTGFIVDSAGYIVTNRHVVSDEEADYTVIFNDGEKIQAEVLAVDSYLDVAVLKVEKKNLPVLEFGNSDNLKAGQTVIAIGNSLGEFRNTVSKGIISGLKRNIQAGDGFRQSESLEEVIQTDAAINPGNSGGPLLNLQGQVIGVNVAMAQGAENIGFAIPSNQIKQIYQQVKRTGKISRPYLGVRYVMLDRTIQKENNLDFDYGALVVRGEKISDLAVIPNSPADKAGIVENDIILEIDGQKISQENDLASLVRKKNVGDSLNLKIWSKGKERSVSVVLEEAD